MKKRRQRIIGAVFTALSKNDKSLVVLGLQHLATTVKTVRADVVAQMGFARRRLNCQRRRGQMVVRTMHTALGRGLFILLDCHDNS
jgi:hypothetical protein